MHARTFLLAIAAFLSPVAAHSQQAVGDSLWRIGNRTEAVEAYLRVIEGDANAVRANFRIAQNLVDRNIDSALVFLRNARQRVPADPDLLFTEATYLSWKSDFAASLLRFDTLLAANPQLGYARVARARVLSWSGELHSAELSYREVLNAPGNDSSVLRDAQLGVAQVASWKGELQRADSLFGELLRSDPDDVRSLVGLAAVRSWAGRPHSSLALLDRALKQDSANRHARQLMATVTRSQSPTAEIVASWSRDSDGNRVAWQNATQAFLLRDGLRVSATVGTQSATDAARETSRLMGEAAGTLTGSVVTLAAGLGVRQLNVNVAPGGITSDRSELTWRASVRVKARSRITFSAGASQFPFDEIASLLARDITLTNFDAAADFALRPGTTVALGGALLDFSDGNRRNAGSMRLVHRLTPGFSIGASGRVIAFEHRGQGYFSPSRFLIGDVNASLDKEVRRWSVGLSAGGGVQQIEAQGPVQGQWHADGRFTYRIGPRFSAGMFGGASTSAAASAVGAFRYEMAGLSLRITF